MTRRNKILKETGSLCPVCLQRIEAAYTEREDGVFFEKECPDHGRFAVPVWGDAPSFGAWQREGPAQPPHRPVHKTERGCPYDCGLCEAHAQATCCVLLEVTGRCNLRCPTCFAAAGEGADDPDLETVAGWYDMLLRQGGPFNIQLSGGEPSLRDDLPAIIEMGRRKGFDFFQLNTNGLRIAEEPEYLRQLARAGLNTVFLQFDSLSREPCIRLRGRDVVAQKKQAVANCADAGVGVVLVPTVEKGCNDGELWEILCYAAAHRPTVRGVHFQPVSYFGRYGDGPEAGGRITIPQLLGALESQSGGRIKASHFQPGGAEHPLCSFYADYRVADGQWAAQARGESAGCCCDSSDTARRSVAEKWSGMSALPQPDLGGYGIRADALDRFLSQKHNEAFAVSGMAFMDAWTLDLERLARCYINVVSPRGELIPFCAYNLTARDGTGLYRGIL